MEERVDKNLKIAYMGNNLLNLGFKIAGVTESYVVADTQQAEGKLRELTDKDDIGIIVMTSAVKRLVKDRRLSETISTSIMPLIVEVPDLNEEFQEEDTLRNLILRAIGIDITKMNI